MTTYFCKLNPPRPTFALDMTPAEQELMHAHAVYWREAGAGRVIAFGLVGDPAGPYGIGIAEFDDEAAARAFTDGDPVIRADGGFHYDVYPMPFGVMRG